MIRLISALAFMLLASNTQANMLLNNYGPFAAGPAPGAVCSTAVTTNGLQSVCDLKIAGAVGPRRVDYKIPGVDSYPSGCSDDSFAGEIYIGCTTSATFGSSSAASAGWDFSTRSGIYMRGNTATVNVYDSLFQAGTCGARNNTYGIWASDNSTTVTVNIGYSTFDGGQCDTSLGVAGPWSGAAIYVNTGATLTIDHSLLTGIGYDPLKCSNATLTMTANYIRTYGWNQNADADAPQLISCNFTASGNFYDISDGSALALAHNFPGTPPNSAIFNTIDTPSSQNSTQTVTNNIFYGYGLYGTTCCTNIHPSGYDGLPFNVLSLCDNHTNTGSGFTLSGTWTNNVIQKANTNYWTEGVGGSMTSANCLAAWSTNLDYDTGATIPLPVFP